MLTLLALIGAAMVANAWPSIPEVLIVGFALGSSALCWYIHQRVILNVRLTTKAFAQYVCEVGTLILTLYGIGVLWDAAT
jgi:hypothetical protein